jgi:hypothetical protein
MYENPHQNFLRWIEIYYITSILKWIEIYYISSIPYIHITRLIVYIHSYTEISLIPCKNRSKELQKWVGSAVHDRRWVG